MKSRMRLEVWALKRNVLLAVQNARPYLGAFWVLPDGDGKWEGFQGDTVEKKCLWNTREITGSLPCPFMLALKGKRALNNMPSLGSFAKNRIWTSLWIALLKFIYPFFKIIEHLCFFLNFYFQIITLIYILIDTFCAQPWW